MARAYIGVPTKNRPHYIKETLRSVLAQTFQDFRVVVSDNCSEEAAVREVREFIEGLNDPRIRYVLQEVDLLEYGQGRFLLSQCNEDEEFFAILHDDDLMEPELLERAIETLDREPDVAFFSSGQHLIDENGDELLAKTASYDRENRRDRAPEGRITDVADQVLGAGVFSISGSVFRTRALHECGLTDEDCEGFFPFEFNVFLRQAEHGVVAYYVREPLVAYRFHSGRQGSYTGDKWCWNQEQVVTMTKLLERRRFSGRPERWRKRLLSKGYRNHGYIMFVVGRWRDGYRLLGKSLRCDPLRWQAWAYSIFAVCAPFFIKPLCKDKARLKTT